MQNEIVNLKAFTDEQITTRYAVIKQQADEMRDDLSAYKTEMLRRMREKNAMKMYHPSYDISRTTSTDYVYEDSTAYEIIETAQRLGLPQELIDAAVIIDTEPKVTVRRAGMNELAKFGKELQELADKCKQIEKDDTLSFKPRKA